MSRQHVVGMIQQTILPAIHGEELPSRTEHAVDIDGATIESPLGNEPYLRAACIGFPHNWQNGVDDIRPVLDEKAAVPLLQPCRQASHWTCSMRTILFNVIV